METTDDNSHFYCQISHIWHFSKCLNDFWHFLDHMAVKFVVFGIY